MPMKKQTAPTTTSAMQRMRLNVLNSISCEHTSFSQYWVISGYPEPNKSNRRGAPLRPKDGYTNSNYLLYCLWDTVSRKNLVKWKRAPHRSALCLWILPNFRGFRLFDVLRTSEVLVGGDAHIAPLGTNEFAEDFRKKRCILPGRCGHRPLRTLQRISKES